MATFSCKGINVVAENGGVQLFKRGELVYAVDLKHRIAGMGPQDVETYLTHTAAVLVDEYLEGSLSGMQELEPWE